MCGYCCGGTPVEKRGAGHKGCSVECYNTPPRRPPSQADIDAAVEARLAPIRALASNWLRLSATAMDPEVREWTEAAGKSLRAALRDATHTDAPEVTAEGAERER